MKTKIISSILIDCLIIQIVLINEGCTSFYSTGMQDIENYCNYEEEILFIMKDSTEVYVPHKGIRQLDRNKIDSVKTVNYNSMQYQVIYTSDWKNYVLKEGSAIDIYSEPQETEWLIFNKDKNEYTRISRADITDILIRKTDPLKTLLLTGIIIGAIILAVNMGAVGFKSSLFSDSDWNL